MYQKRYVCSCVNKRLKKAKEDVDRESGSSDRETKQASETRRTSVSELLPDGK